MRKTERAEQARRSLDAKFSRGTIEAVRVRPRSGWIKAVRAGLGMSQEALAERLGVTRLAVTKLEHAEANGGITVSKLSQVAAALDCTLVYALLPNQTLEDTVRRQAAKVVGRDLGYVGATMALEDQAVGEDERSAVFQDQVAAAIDRGNIWRS